MLKQRGKGKIWWYRFKFGGRVIHESTKSTSVTVAREAERQRRRQLEESWNQITKRKMPPTFEQASREWLAKRVALAASTRETYAHALKHLNASLGKSLICDIEARDVAAYQNARAAEGAAGATINKEFTVLASILADRGRWAEIRRDVKRLDENESAGHALLPDEEARLLQASSQVGLKQGHWSPIYTVTVLGLNTGLRHSEVRKRCWADVNLEKRVLVVGKTKTEAGSGRPVPLTPAAWSVLDMWASRFPNRKPSDYVFPACVNGHLNPSKPIAHWRTAWHRACILAGLPRLRYHDLRHSAATKMLENGVPIATVAQVLGWSASTAIRMAKRYGHIRPEAQRQALESIATPLPVEHRVGGHQKGNQVVMGPVLVSKLTN
jgi:integrase